MATGTNAIALESEVKAKTDSTASITTNLCCTKARAIILGADSSKLSSYQDNQLVKYSDIYKKSGGTTPTNYYYAFSVTFFFTSNKLCAANQDGYVRSGIGFLGTTGYITLDSDDSSHNTFTHTAYLKSNSQIQLISTSISAWPNCFQSIGGTFENRYVYSTTNKTLTPYDILNSVYYSGSGFNVNGTTKSASNYVYYLAEDPWDGYKEPNFSDYIYYKKEQPGIIYGSNIQQSPNQYHIWIFEDIYLKNQLLGEDASSYE